MDAIRTNNLCKTYGTKVAVDQVNLEVPKGAIYGFIGRNGSGKSTTQKMICGVAHPTAGELSLFGKPGTDPSVRSQVGALIETPGIYPGMSAVENLILQGYNVGVENPKKEALVNLAMVGLEANAKKKAKALSLGMKQRLGIAIALTGNPNLLILDEPSNGLDPEGIIDLRNVILRLNEEAGITMLISSHILGELSKIATHYGVIKEGKLVEQVTAEEMQRKRESYLSVSVSEPREAMSLIKNNIQPEDCKIDENGSLRIYGVTDTGAVNQLLTGSGYKVQEIYLHKQDLEEYFINLMGDEKVA